MGHSRERVPRAMASTTSKVVFGASAVFAGSIIYYVHHQQVEDQRRLKKGIEMDVERQARKRQNLAEQLQQQEIQKVYKRLEKEEDELKSKSN